MGIPDIESIVAALLYLCFSGRFFSYRFVLAVGVGDAVAIATVLRLLKLHPSSITFVVVRKSKGTSRKYNMYVSTQE